MNLQHIEIEHKFLVSKRFDLPSFHRKMRALGSIKQTSIKVCDTYYFSAQFPGRIFRHRLDNEIQHLTMKSRGLASDARQEVNLKMLVEDQSSAVSAFLAALGCFRKIKVHKEVEAFYFPDCEVVFYKARSGKKSVHCVEFEATRKKSLTKARQILNRYEMKAGFSEQKREKKSLFELLVLPQLTQSAAKRRKQKR